jgi:hypothetical protein
MTSGWVTVESHHAKARLAAPAMQPLKHDFGKSLGCPHHIGGVDGFVRGHQHKGVHIGFMSRFGGIPGRDDIVMDALDHVLFDDGYVLVGRGVIHGLYPVGLQNIAQPKLVMGIADESDQIEGERILIGEGAQFTLDVVQRQFGHFEQNQPLRTQADDLPA